ncbi:uncharacterized protein PSFLO_01365 [Pseudozyma flocculosa]|uniref:EF-hand domain-containing protein n=1 Tax=Pseudozyma flocculosa TaxID=84751 RepID=A0A5C3EU60_9BASI|nr:uncharacterized protein PSFLO_01365 [Pseudozyma flocculosa]
MKLQSTVWVLICALVALATAATASSAHRDTLHQHHKSFLQSAKRVNSSHPAAQADESANGHHLVNDAGKGYVSLWDQNRDGKLSLGELEFALDFAFEDPERGRTARLVMGSPEAKDILRVADVNGDGFLTAHELQTAIEGEIAARARRNEKPTSADRDCTAVNAKMETCATQDVLTCAPYAGFAETSCRLGRKTEVEACILENKCGDICGCLQKLEAKALARKDLEGQAPKHDAETDTNDNASGPTNGRKEKRLIPIFLGLIIAEATATEIAVGITSAAILAASAIILQTKDNLELQAISPFMDTVIWDGNGSPPPCSNYIFWSTQCGAIRSSKARNCKPLGSRVYGNSCLDGLRTGSKACGFLYLGCRSLCWNSNTEDCSCSIFNYRPDVDVFYPGHVIGAYNVSKISECAGICDQDTKCAGFEVPPLSTHNAANCYTKDGHDSVIAQVGNTEFVRIAQPAADPRRNTCGRGRGYFDMIPYGYDWGPVGTFQRRSLSEETGEASLGNVLVTAAHRHAESRGIQARQQKPNDYDYRYVAGSLWLALQIFYRSRTSPAAIANQPILNGAYNGAEWATLQTPDVIPFDGVAIGSMPAYAAQPIQNTDGGGWNFVELQTRVEQVHRRMLELGSASAVLEEVQRSGDQNYINYSAPNELLSIVQNNDNVIRSVNADGSTWQFGGPIPTRPNGQAVNNVNPVTNIALPYETRTNFFQRGAVGPLTVEAAFMIGTQMAGVHYANLRANAQRAEAAGTGAGDTTGSFVYGVNGNGLTPAVGTDGCITTTVPGYDENGEEAIRNMGVVAFDWTVNYAQDTRAGMYFSFDMDPAAGEDQQNVLLFIVQPVDASSYIQEPEGDQNAGYTNPQYASYVRIATKAANQRKNPRTPIPLGSNTPANPAPRTRAIAHAHVAVARRSDWLGWVSEGGSYPPPYTQIGEMHLYLNPEDIAGYQYRYQNRGGMNPDGSADGSLGRRQDDGGLNADLLGPVAKAPGAEAVQSNHERRWIDTTSGLRASVKSALSSGVRKISGIQFTARAPRLDL